MSLSFDSVVSHVFGTEDPVVTSGWYVDPFVVFDFGSIGKCVFDIVFPSTLKLCGDIDRCLVGVMGKGYPPSITLNVEVTRHSEGLPS